MLKYLSAFILPFTFVLVSFCGEITLPAIFSDHAVLARHNAVPVFGKAAPGEKITVKIAGVSRTVTADKKGDFLAEVDLSQATPGPHILQINEHKIKDVLVGGVFLASGQSNMVFALRNTENFSREAKLPEDPGIRFFIVERTAADSPAKTVEGVWKKSHPAVRGNFSGTAYYFAKKLNRETGIPVGIIQSCVGGTAIEAWMSKSALQKFPFARSMGDERRREYNGYPEKYRLFLEANREWEERFNRQDLPEPHTAPPADAKWETLKGDRFAGNGIIWLKQDFTLSEKESAAGFRIAIGQVYLPVSLWIDGKKVSSITDEAWKHSEYLRYSAGKGEFPPGKHILMLRFHVSGNNVFLRSMKKNGSSLTKHPWQMYRQKDFGKYSDAAGKSRPQAPGRRLRYLWSQYYNGMISPLAPYRLTGIIWYQGESNARRAWQYRKLFPAMIQQWRSEFRDEKLPFYYVMLAPYLAKTSDAGSSGDYAELRAAQLESLKVPHTAMAVISDAGEAQDIHPLDKSRPGERLAALALKNIYGRDVPCESPRAVRAISDKGKVTLVFTNTYGGLTAAQLPGKYHLRKAAKRKAPLLRNSPAAQLEGFALADANGKWHWADKAEIIAPDRVEVSAAAVPEPVKIRYNYSNNPTCNLFNKAGFPAAPCEFLLQ